MIFTLHLLIQCELGVTCGSAGDQCVFLDSIFAQSDKNYRSVISRYLASSDAQQIVLILTQSQWDTVVQSELEEHITNCYKILSHRNNIDNKQFPSTWHAF